MRTAEALLDHGWRIFTVWECSLKGPGRQPLPAIIDRCAAFIRGKRQRRQNCAGSQAVIGPVESIHSLMLAPDSPASGAAFADLSDRNDFTLHPRAWLGEPPSHDKRLQVIKKTTGINQLYVPDRKQVSEHSQIAGGQRAAIKFGDTEAVFLIVEGFDSPIAIYAHVIFCLPQVGSDHVNCDDGPGLDLAQVHP